LGERYIKVNIANFELQVIEKDKIVFMSHAIVGRSFRETPIFSSMLTYLVLNPDWTIPPTILYEDIIPAVVNNPNYLAKNQLKVLRNDGSEVNPLSIDWDSIATYGFPYRVLQNPGPKNALGSVKFIFPNKYNVYIHDTPSRYLFNRTDRPFSSGCIRVQDPLDLAAWLLNDNPKWTPDLIKDFVEKGETRTVRLSKPIPVHIIYLTAWANSDGVVYFRKDVYNRDEKLLAALKQKHPGKY
jgi:L,D-transpeptidase YcbB